jgi:hypothetical protein
MQFASLPRVNLAALMIDEDEAANELIQHIPRGADIAEAAKALDDLLNGRSDALVNAAVDAAVDEFLDPLFAGLDALPDRSALTAANYVDANAPGLTANLRVDLSQITDPPGRGITVIGKVQVALDKLKDGLEVADLLLRKEGNGQWQVAGGGKRLSFLDTTVGIGGAEVQGALASIDQLINVDLRSTLDDVHAAVVDVHYARDLAADQLESVRVAAEAALDAVNGARAAGGVAKLAITDIQQYFASANDPTGRFLIETDRTALRADLKRLVRDRVHASTFVSGLQLALKDLLEPLRNEYRTAFERMHGVINDVLRSAFSEMVGELADQLNGDAATANRATGDFNDTLELAKIEGSAQIEGDSLVAAHLNASIGLRVPDRIGVSGWLDFRQTQSDQPALPAAKDPPDGRIEIEIGAEGGATIGGEPPVYARLVGRYAMAANGEPLAVGGTLDFDTDLKFEGMTLKHAHFEFAFGDRDNYLYGQGSGSVWFIDADVRAFLGQTTDPKVLEREDPLLGDVLAPGVTGFGPISRDNPITGVYWNGDGEGSLNRFFGIPDSPLLRITGKGGEGHFMFFNKALVKDPLGNLPPDAKLLVGLRSRKGLNVTLLAATADAELRVLGALNPLPLVRTADFADLQETILSGSFLPEAAVAGAFTPSFGVGVGPAKVEVKKTFKFRAAGRIAPPPLAPPPGFVWVNKLDFSWDW